MYFSILPPYHTPCPSKHQLHTGMEAFDLKPLDT